VRGHIGIAELRTVLRGLGVRMDDATADQVRCRVFAIICDGLRHRS
jgi:hypothetical protein